MNIIANPPYIPPVTSCSFYDPPQSSATADGNQSSYAYELSCGQVPGLVNVSGGYNFDTNEADEELRYGTTDIRAVWTCPHDPWIAPSAVVCARKSPALAVGIPAFDLNEQTSPFGTEYLNDDLRQALLFAQLKYAIDQAAIMAAQQAAKEAAAKAAFLATEVTPIAPSGAILSVQHEANQAAFLATEVTPITTTGSCAACTAVVATPAIYHAPSIVAGWPQLSLYTQGEAVTSLQYLLMQSGATVSVDGKFGSSTDAAVRAFQKAQVPPLTADGTGIVGQQTWLALIVTVQQGSQGAAVKAVQSQLNVQSRLNARGGQAVVVDGSFGGQTDAAVQTFQQAHGLTVDGQVGPKTWQPLLVGS